MSADKEQMDSLRAMAWNDVTREIAEDGVELTSRQAASLGDDVIDWMRKRLGLCSDNGLTFVPEHEEAQS